ncbi:MAG: patatin-like phospholipase family protein [Alphaproteobacteria bacterium]|nr:patatin-like phospholipase family protein [Alphaproteobacteria bacterium]
MENLKKWFVCCIISVFFIFSNCSASKSMTALEPLKSEKRTHVRMGSFFKEGKKDVAVHFHSHTDLDLDSISNSEYDEDSDDDASSSTSESLCLSPMFELSPPRPTKIILTIDGGGSRGIIPLFYIGELYRRLSREFGEEVRLPIDMYAGTSVGALIVTAVAMGKYDEVRARYFDLAKQIFSYKWWKWPFTKIFRGYTYESSGRAAAFRELVTPESERAIESDLIIPFCSAKTHDIFKYRNYDDIQRFTLFNALMASTAAPTHFSPHVFKGLDNEYYEGTDGGIWANHPGAIALDDAFQRYPGARYIMISLGTGHASAAGTSTKGRSLIGWAGTIADLCMSLQSKKTDDVLISIAGNHHSEVFRYIRINPMLDRKDCITDGVSRSHLEHLSTIARQSIEPGGSEKRKFDEVVDILKAKLDY